MKIISTIIFILLLSCSIDQENIIINKWHEHETLEYFQEYIIIDREDYCIEVERFNFNKIIFYVNKETYYQLNIGDEFYLYYGTQKDLNNDRKYLN